MPAAAADDGEIRLHLGCGRRYLDGYVNVDFPPSEHTVQADLTADIHADIVSLRYLPATVGEIRLHHVFEHFDRPTALALLCRWRDWLRPGGTLRIETPDVSRSVLLLASPFTSYGDKQQVLRHLFGSHESHWAAHLDGWSAERFRRTLVALGYVDVRPTHTRWGVLRNVEVEARKPLRDSGARVYEPAVRDLLAASLVTVDGETAQSELELLEVWMDKWRALYGR